MDNASPVMYEGAAIVGALLPIAVIVYVTIAVWLGARRKEREAFYRSEILKKIADSEGDAAQRVLDMMRQQEIEAQIRRREGLKLGGLITFVFGIALSIFLAKMVIGQPVWLAGLIFILVGAVLAGYAFFFAPKPGRKD